MKSIDILRRFARISQPSTASPRVSSARRGDHSSRPGRRTSSFGGRRDRCRARPGSCRCARAPDGHGRRASSPVIHFDSPDGSAILPSIDSASLSVMRGRPSSSRVSQPASERCAAFAADADLHLDPGVAKPLDALAAVRGSGSLSAITTRAGFASSSRSAQAGPRSLSWAQGSSVT